MPCSEPRTAVPRALACIAAPLSRRGPARRPATIGGTITTATSGVVPGVTVTRATTPPASRTTVTGPQDGHAIAGLPPGTYDSRRDERLQAAWCGGIAPDIGENVVVNLTLQLGGVETVEEVGDRRRPRSATRPARNGRNYTDLALLQPGVIAYPHRDGGSVVAHGLGMSVNGQDPRSNVYLLDGTLQNDFTNGPAGSAAGTALGMETIREFRVESNAYSAEFGRNSAARSTS